MDALSRKKAQEAEEAKKRVRPEENHVADDFNPRVRPRETHPDDVDPQARVSRNLDKLNRELVAKPDAAAAAGPKGKVRVVSRRRPLPIALILAVVVITATFMYMLTLNVQIEERSRSISALESSIAELKEEKTRLDVQLENKYDLNEIERVATQDYGMVSADSLPKKYIKVGDTGDVYETNNEVAESGFSKLISGFASFFRDLFR